MRKIFLLAYLVCALPLLAQAQFNSGSTGANGALDLSTCPDISCFVQLPESGVLNYTTVNIPANRFLLFRRNSRNTPVVILAQSNINIAGIITVAGNDYNNGGGNTTPGPGGFYGGQPGQTGFGPSGGQVNCANRNGRWVGPLSLVPITGGSGSAGISCIVFDYGYGLGGGGAIVIASSTSITTLPSSTIKADGGAIYGSGSGGAIRLVANSLNVGGVLSAAGGNNGVIRLEATNLSFTGSSNPAAILAPINPTIVLSAMPQLTIQSIGGSVVPSYSGSRFDTVDLLLPNQLTDPVSVVVRGNNIPVGTEVRVGFVSGSSNGTSTPCNLVGTDANSQCTATISNLTRTGVTYLLATATFAPPAPLAKNNPKGKDQIAQIRLELVLGKQPKYVFLRSDNSAIDAAKVPKEFLQYFGM